MLTITDICASRLSSRSSLVVATSSFWSVRSVFGNHWTWFYLVLMHTLWDTLLGLTVIIAMDHIPHRSGVHIHGIAGPPETALNLNQGSFSAHSYYPDQINWNFRAPCFYPGSSLSLQPTAGYFQSALNIASTRSLHSVLHCRYPESTLNPHSTLIGDVTFSSIYIHSQKHTKQILSRTRYSGHKATFLLDAAHAYLLADHRPIFKHFMERFVSWQLLFCHSFNPAQDLFLSLHISLLEIETVK